VYTAFGATPTRPAMPRTDAAATPPSSSRLSVASRISSSLSVRPAPGRPLRPVLVIDALLDGFLYAVQY
jgi:hypothetical protein